jgi:hypothetical protein
MHKQVFNTRGVKFFVRDGTTKKLSVNKLFLVLCLVNLCGGRNVW